MDSTDQGLGDNTPPELPPRSRLYNPEPVGLGTPYVESLSGYAARLAVKHSTNLFYLFSREVAPLINKPGTISRRVSFASFAKAVNGLGITAADLVAVFESLAFRTDLRFTTMLPWAGVLSSKSLTRVSRAWCPECYEECALGDGEVYDQLLWVIQSVMVCPKHGRWLELKCQRCGQRQRTLSHRVRPGFCGRCQSWLGYRPDGVPQAGPPAAGVSMEEELRVAEEIGKMLAAAPSLSPSELAGRLTKRLRVHAGKLFLGRGVPSKTELPAGKQTIRWWLRGIQTPTLSLLIKTCLALQLSPVELLAEDADHERGRQTHPTSQDGMSGGRRAGEAGGVTVPTPIDWKDAGSLAFVEGRLVTALSEYPPVSLTKIAKELKCVRGTLRKKFPALAAKIAERALAYYRPPVDDEEMSKVVKAALKENPPPPLAEVSRRLGAGASMPTLHKKFPRESRMIVERFLAHNKRRLDDHGLEKQFRAVLKRNPPPSMREVARGLGVAAPTLYRKFPKLFKAVSSRFAAYRRERDERNRELVRAEVKSACENLLQAGIYPSFALVRSRLTVPCQSQAFSQIRREVLAELSFPDCSH